MKFSGIHLEHFKRFTNLTIQGLGPEVRLVVLAGPNVAKTPEEKNERLQLAAR